MNTNDIIHKEEVFAIVGVGMEVLNYLRATGHRVGLIINFHKAKLEWERIVL